MNWKNEHAKETEVVESLAPALQKSAEIGQTVPELPEVESDGKGVRKGFTS